MPSETCWGWQSPLCKFNGAEMTGFFSRIFRKNDTALKDAKRIYSKLMIQSRNPAFYGEGKASDNYDGRIDMLTLHVSVILNALNVHGEQGARLSQAIYDVMRDDFEIAMREEGLSDTGIKRRIKPMMQLFFTRVKTYVEALQNQSDLKPIFAQGLLNEGTAESRETLERHIQQFSQSISEKTLGEIAMAEFSFSN